jgi:hypothetical protein
MYNRLQVVLELLLEDSIKLLKTINKGYQDFGEKYQLLHWILSLLALLMAGYEMTSKNLVNGLGSLGLSWLFMPKFNPVENYALIRYTLITIITILQLTAN